MSNLEQVSSVAFAVDCWFGVSPGKSAIWLGSPSVTVTVVEPVAPCPSTAVKVTTLLPATSASVGSAFPSAAAIWVSLTNQRNDAVSTPFGSVAEPLNGTSSPGVSSPSGSERLPPSIVTVGPGFAACTVILTVASALRSPSLSVTLSRTVFKPSLRGSAGVGPVAGPTTKPLTVHR